VPRADAAEAFFAPLGAASASFDGATLSGDVLAIEDVAVLWDVPASLRQKGMPASLAMSVPLIEIRRLVRTDEGHAADRIDVPLVRLSSGDDELILADVSLRSPSFPAAPARAADPAGPLAAMKPALRWLSRLDAAAVTLSAGRTVVSAEGIADGRFATIRVADTVDDGPVGPLTVTNLDLRALLAALYDSAADGARRTFVERAVVERLVPGNAGSGRVSIDRVVLKDLALGTAAPSVAAGIDGLLALDAAGVAVAPESRAAAFARAAGVVSVGEIAFEGVLAESPHSRNGAGRIAVGPVAAGAGTRIVAEDLFLDDIGRASPERRRTADLALAEIGLKLPEAEAVARLFAAEPAAADVLAAVPRLGRIELGDLVAREAAGVVSIASPRVTIDLDGHIGPLPTRVRYAAQYRIALPQGTPPEVAEMLRARGIEAITVSESMAADYDGATETLSVAWEGEADSLARFSLAFSLSGLSRVVFEAPGRAAETMATLALANARLEIADRGLGPIGIDLLERTGGTREEAVAAVAGFLETTVAPFVPLPLGSGPFALADRILAEEATIVIAATPQRPIPLTEIAAAATLAPLRLSTILDLSLAVGE